MSLTHPYKYFYDFYSSILSRKEEINVERAKSNESLFTPTSTPTPTPLFTDKSYNAPNKVESEEPKKVPEEESASIFPTIFSSKDESPKDEAKEEEEESSSNPNAKENLEEKGSIFTFLSNSIFAKKEKKEISTDEMEESTINEIDENIPNEHDTLEGTFAFYENRRREEYKNAK